MSEPKVKLSIKCECCPDSEVVECDQSITLAIRDGQDLELIKHNVSDSEVMDWLLGAIRSLFDQYALDKPE